MKTLLSLTQQQSGLDAYSSCELCYASVARHAALLRLHFSRCANRTARSTSQVIFTDPYYDAPHNRHTSPALDDAAVALRRDAPAKAAATAAKAKFLTNRQALLHGDLHTGSCMVTRDTYYVIDSEFAFYGPMAFDVGKLIANVLLTFFALDGHSSAADGREHQRAYLLQVRCADIYNVLRHKLVTCLQAACCAVLVAAAAATQAVKAALQHV